MNSVSLNEVCYVSGPMSGLSDHNYQEFDMAADQLRSEGYVVLNPAENFAGLTDNARTNCDRTHFMRLDIHALLQVDCVFVLDKWYRSKGARLEVAIAFELGIPVYTYSFRTQLSSTDLTSIDKAGCLSEGFTHAR